MKIYQLQTNPCIYSGNSFLILGSWNKLDDVNALIDTGSDGYIMHDIKQKNTGVGKKAVDKIILTHCHFDHIGGLNAVKNAYGAEICAKYNFEGVERILEDGEVIKLGDCYFEVLHTPGHSSDSICLYCKNEAVLFSGDINLRINVYNENFSEEYFNTFEKLSRLKINIIYPGHGQPIIEKPEEIIKISFNNIKMSRHIAPWK